MEMLKEFKDLSIYYVRKKDIDIKVYFKEIRGTYCVKVLLQQQKKLMWNRKENNMKVNEKKLTLCIFY